MAYLMVKHVQWQIYLKPLSCDPTEAFKRTNAWMHARTHAQLHIYGHTLKNATGENAMQCISLKTRRKVVHLHSWHPLTSCRLILSARWKGLMRFSICWQQQCLPYLSTINYDCSEIKLTFCEKKKFNFYYTLLNQCSIFHALCNTPFEAYQHPWLSHH